MYLKNWRPLMMIFENIFKNYLVVIIILVIAFIIIIILVAIYNGSKRIKTLHDLPKKFENTWLTGYAVKVGDGDGFQFFHTPKFFSRKYKNNDECLSIRLAGIDAPEVRYFNKEAQPYSKKSKEYLQRLILNKKITIKILAIDIYNRLLATVYVKGIKSKNVNIDMVKMGLACVYIGRNAVYDGYKNKLLEVEKKARKNKLNMWSQKNYVSPMEYKRKYR